MHEIATAAGIDYDVNEKALRSLVAEATYGGTLCVIWQPDTLSDIVNAGGRREEGHHLLDQANPDGPGPLQRLRPRR